MSRIILHSEIMSLFNYIMLHPSLNQYKTPPPPTFNLPTATRHWPINDLTTGITNRKFTSMVVDDV